MRPESKVVRTTDNPPQSQPAQGTPQSGQTTDDKIRQYYNEQFAKQLESEWQEYTVNPPLQLDGSAPPVDGQTMPGPVVVNSDPVYYTPAENTEKPKPKKLSPEEKQAFIKDMIDHQDFRAETARALQNDNNYKRYMSDVIDYTAKISDLEYEITNLQKEHNALSAGNSQNKQFEQMEIKSQIDYKKREIRGLQGYINKTLSAAFEYAKFIDNWKDGVTSQHDSIGWGKLDLASTITTVTLKNGQKAYKDNNGIYYGIDARHPSMPDPKNIIDVSKIK